ncbi:MAG: threonine-phosphate decarboxylase CobD [Pseudotabrizicola sp.]|uniref:threonine-phosphate decarboxylase CobD n=1 Tax=Pseudotabrizicola sp. TaxID=2939647 RepID=UPI00271F08CA|nr:threonine-phosphate decarboxylase CobD [Pseudotabrizicola sp.]MDO8881357.1 threonine-phosphate decarboxylase CobD [Pseudotabrizicola sp.]MDP2080192.1 threonine-phosphate decarboxylase CobD [Pseudotabrizicola sp.]MDZ7575275.1 threonine-phosphate decarboxylase CobD [Pseudotabrizicola sp.]
MRDHGGNLDQAVAVFGTGDWIDLSTGINRRPWPLPLLDPDCWRSLPTRAAQAGLVAQAARAWGASDRAAGIALAGAQAAIQLMPLLRPAGRAAVLGPTYNEHAACLIQAGWDVASVSTIEALHGAALAVVVNPNNPDGRCHTPEDMLALSRKVGFLVVDESFGDITPGLSLLPQAGQDNLLILRSFGKFYGLAGLRLGFAFGADSDIAALARMAGPWAVSGPAIEIGRQAISDTGWADAMRTQLALDAGRADDLARVAGWKIAGGTTLFRLYETPDAQAAQHRLARHKIWSRIFPWSGRLLRLGLPGPEPEWDRLSRALRP